MNRREFLKSSAAIVALLALGGCKKEEIAKAAKRGTMTYREFPGIGAKISLLGYGLMRMPKIGSGPEIDKEKAKITLFRFCCSNSLNSLPPAPHF